jgi:hypothetical protein
VGLVRRVVAETLFEVGLVRRVGVETLFEVGIVGGVGVGLVRIVGGVGVVMRVAAVAETIVNLVDKRNSSLTAGFVSLWH